METYPSRVPQGFVLTDLLKLGHKNYIHIIKFTFTIYMLENNLNWLPHHAIHVFYTRYSQ